MNEGVIKTKVTEVSTTRSRFLAVSGIILSSSLMAVASGLLFAFIPVKLLAMGFEPWVPAAMTPALALGGLVGCFATGPLLRISGHARVFMLMYALVIISMVTIAFFENPVAWMAARTGYGFAVNGIFIVAQSWLHHASTDAIRGKVISIFYVGYVVALGCGSFLVGYIDTSGNAVPILGSFFVAVAMLPVALTRLPQPEPPDRISVDIRKVWNISPVGMAGMMAVGGLTMVMQSISPIYAASVGFTTKEVGLLLLIMQLGLVAIQVPLGALSDRIDRRIVLAIVASGSILIPMVAYSSHGAMSLFILILLFTLWNGFNETIYSVSSALANDRADPGDYVMLSSTQMISWSLAAFVVPLIATFALAYLPVQSYMLVGVLIGVPFLAFVIYRMRVRNDVEAEDKDGFQPVTAQVAFPGDYSNPDAYEDEEAGSTEGLR